MKTNKKQVTLVINPFYRGIGFLAYRSLNQILDYGIKRADNSSKYDFFEMTKDLIDYCRPDVILLLSSKGFGKPSKKINKVIELIIKYVLETDMTLHTYTQLQINSIFQEFGVDTKFDRSQLLIKLYPLLESISPKTQINFICSHYQTPVFDSFAVMVAHEDQMLSEES